MKEDKYFFCFNQQPGLELKNYEKYKNIKPEVSIVTSYFNAKKFMWQTINCVLNQTFPFWEWIIVDDGSTNKEDIEFLEHLKTVDDRIKIFRKENEGLAKGRDYAIKHSITNYILPLDADDLIEPTYIETLYWSLETNKKPSWAFTDSLGFGKYIYFANELFDSEIMKIRNQVTATALIRKEKILELNGYGVAKRYVNEDWHLWLRMIAKGYYPIQATYYGFWYRRRKNSLLSEINDEKKEDNKLRLRDIKNEADKIKKRVVSVAYINETNQDINKEELEYNTFNYSDLKFNNKKESVLYIIPEIGFNRKLQKEIKDKYKKNDIYILSIESSKKSQYANRQNIEKYATVFNLTSFLEKKYFKRFIEYIIDTREVKDIYISSQCKEKEKITKNLKEFEYINYSNSNFLYNFNIIKYKVSKFIVIRAIKKIYRVLLKNERMEY